MNCEELGMALLTKQWVLERAIIDIEGVGIDLPQDLNPNLTELAWTLLGFPKYEDGHYPDWMYDHWVDQCLDGDSEPEHFVAYMRQAIAEAAATTTAEEMPEENS
jgi:hypothetical protein